MLSLAAIVLCLALVFIYRALNPALHPVPKIAKRARVGVGAVIMVLAVASGYLLPVETARGLSAMAQRQQAQQEARTERQMSAERQHTARMIEIFGSAEAYLLYQNVKTAHKSRI